MSTLSLAASRINWALIAGVGVFASAMFFGTLPLRTAAEHDLRSQRGQAQAVGVAAGRAYAREWLGVHQAVAALAGGVRSVQGDPGALPRILDEATEIPNVAAIGVAGGGVVQREARRPGTPDWTGQPVEDVVPGLMAAVRSAIAQGRDGVFLAIDGQGPPMTAVVAVPWDARAQVVDRVPGFAYGRVPLREMERAAGIDRVRAEGYDVWIDREAGGRPLNAVPNADPAPADALELLLPLPGETLVLRLRPEGGWAGSPALAVSAVLLWVVALALGFGTFRILRTRRRRASLVAARTADLVRVNTGLQDEIERRSDAGPSLLGAQDGFAEAQQARRDQAAVTRGMESALAALPPGPPLARTQGAVLAAMCAPLKADAAAVYVAAPGADRLFVDASCGLAASLPNDLRFPLGFGAAGGATAGHDVAIVCDLPAAVAAVVIEGQLPEAAKAAARQLAATYATSLGVPLNRDGRGQGSITLYYAKPRTFDDEYLNLARFAAAEARLAIANARSHYYQERRRVVSESLRETLEALNREAETFDVLQVVLAKTQSVLEAQAVVLYRAKPAAGELTLERAAGIFPTERPVVRVPWGCGPVGEAVVSRRPQVLYPNSSEALAKRAGFPPDNAAYAAKVAAEYGSVIAVPIPIHGSVYGAMALRYLEERRFDDDDLELAGLAAGQVGLAIDNALTREWLNRRRQVAESFRDALRTINADQPLEATLGELLRQTRAVLGVDAALLYRIDAVNGRLEVRQAAGVDPRLLGALSMEPGQGAAGRAFAAQAPQVCDLNSPEAQLHREARPGEQGAARATLAAAVPWVLAVPVTSSGVRYGALEVLSSEPWGDPLADVELAQLAAEQLALALDNAETKDQLHRRREVAECLRALVALVNDQGRVDRVAQLAVEEVQRAMGANAVTLHRLDPETRVFTVVLSTGIDPGDFSALGLPLLGTTVGRAMAAHQIYTVTDLRPALAQGMLAGFPDDVRRAMARVGERLPSAMVVPVVIAGDLYGAFSLHFAQTRSFSLEDRALAMQMADQVGLALENASLREKAADAATAAERERLAGELHDVVSQTLFAASLEADLLPAIWERDHQQGLEHLEGLRHLTRSALMEMRQLLMELRPSQLVRTELSELIRRLGEAFANRLDVPVEVNAVAVGRLPDEVQTTFYRTAQESLNNILKHAHASRVVITLMPTQGGAFLEVEDDGDGFDPATVGPGHFGLGIMEDRVKAIGATVTIDSAAGRGTLVRLDWKASDP